MLDFDVKYCWAIYSKIVLLSKVSSSKDNLLIPIAIWSTNSASSFVSTSVNTVGVIVVLITGSGSGSGVTTGCSIVVLESLTGVSSVLSETNSSSLSSSITNVPFPFSFGTSLSSVLAWLNIVVIEIGVCFTTPN